MRVGAFCEVPLIYVHTNISRTCMMLNVLLYANTGSFHVLKY